jgi:tetratricopeptide (TPR) repeat protein
MVNQLAQVHIGLIVAPLAIASGLLTPLPALAIQHPMANFNDALAQNDSLAEADRLYQEGSRILREGTDDQLPQAVEQLERARQLYRAEQFQDEEGRTLTLLASAVGRLGDPAQAIDYLQAALLLFRSVQQEAAEADALQIMGLFYQRLGDSQEALRRLNQSIPLFQTLGDQAGHAVSLEYIAPILE